MENQSNVSVDVLPEIQDGVFCNKLNVYEGRKLGGDKCWYCGVELTEDTKTADHFWPRSLRGRLKVVCCANCNRLKGNLTPNGFVDLLKSLKNKHPKNAPFQQKFDRMIRATETLWERVKLSV